MRFLNLIALPLFIAPASAFSQGFPFALCNGGDDGANAWICGLTDGVTTGEENTVRCANATQSLCEINAGGVEAVPGPHNVPASAWFAQASFKPGSGMIKCQCGCFTEDMNILTTEGWLSFSEATDLAGRKPFRVAIPGKSGELQASESLSKRDFTVGPEDKPVLRIVTEKGQAIHLTETHPVVVNKHGHEDMVQADVLKKGDLLLLSDGETTPIVEVSSYLLPANSKNVYNVDTKASTPAGHVIVVNGLQMGDVKWQARLSEANSRVENLQRASQQ